MGESGNSYLFISQFAGDGNDDGQTKDSQHEHFAGAKVHGHISHQRREEGHDQSTDDAAVQAVSLPKKADFYASAAQAQQFPYLSAACFSVLLFPLFTVPRLFAAVCIFSRKRPKAAYPKYAVLEAEL